MKAFILTGSNGPDSLQLTEAEKPAMKADEVLVRVTAISLNPVDYKTAKGQAMWTRISEYPPVISGWDIAGEVVETGKNVTQFTTGDAVFGMVNFPGAGRAYAEYVAAPAAHLAHQPAHVSHEEAVAATLAAQTAWQVLDKAGVQSGQRVLIHAAAGGVGHFAVQLAKLRGAYVIGTASAGKLDFVKSLGADEVIDYTRVRFEEVVQPVHFVFDPIGKENSSRSLNIIRPEGKLISIVGVSPELVAEAKKKEITAQAYLVASSGSDQAAIAGLLTEGKLKAHVSQTFPFSRLPDAMRQIATGKTQGKVVVTV